ncbi:conserved hypothetical protein [Histoplasma capsulatum var. duboisii H88]|uniref:Nucleolar 27S pre-rRNA processing Urb2/Npa2 C-terminal domain-containing protein n=2 Tax=Ajellomyces capsulatus TaxID=5037 RepID=F0UST1_AJEC8|nr:conserved hypothetical protein [Histoplasma capsulatum H143]EGC48958.1 conserved hypothetical protein [Histoplasma capsulatum var. duboisii H88]QSS54555.1 hypothetical protein I7I53_02134 [Histoplasma capsulatum var. duboisii H88]
MAPALESSSFAHQALLELERATGGPASQLQEAARIIGADLSFSCNHGTGYNGVFQDAESNKKQKPSAPKEAWVLRWLMKKLKASSPQREELQTNYRLHTQTWILLRQLLERISIKPLAFILNEHKFLLILKYSLADIMDASNASPERLEFQESLHSESSATIQGSPVSEAWKRGQKRKRMENGLDSVEPQGAIRGSWIDTFCAVLKSVKTLVALAHEFSGVESASHSHLQLVLRGEPQTAAAILGQSFVLTRKVVEKWDKRFPELHAQLMRALSATLDIWRLSSERLGDATNLSSDNTFSSYCLSEALHLLMVLRQIGTEPAENTNVIQSLERIVVLHFVLPLRQSFYSIDPMKTMNTNGSPNPSVIKHVLKDVHSRWAGSNDRSNTELLPILLDVAVRAVPRDTFKRQVHEAPWLETLFVALSTIAGCPLFDEPSWSTSHKDIPVLENLFQVTIDRKASLSIDTIGRYAVRFSGLVGGEAHQATEWSLISKLILTGVDVFLPNPGFDGMENLLSNLIDRITSFSLVSNIMPNETYGVIKTTIVIPLLRGFAAARAIGSFLDIWSDQLTSIEAARLNGRDIFYLFVWEDDDLAAALRPLVTDLFSENQTKDHLQVILSQHSFDDEENAPKHYADILLLDAIWEPRLQGDSMLQGEPLAQAFRIVSNLALSKRQLAWRWRLWRLSQRFVDHHSSTPDDVSVDLSTTLLPKAIDVLQNFHNQEFPTNISRSDCLEAFEAFKFVVLVAGRKDSPQYNEYLNAIMPRIVPTFNQVTRFTGAAWDGRVDTMVSPQTVCVGYLIVLLATPLAVTRLTSENRGLLFNNLLTSVERFEYYISNPLSRRAVGSSLECQLLEIWQSFTSNEWLLETPAAVYDLVNTILHRLKEKKIPRHLSIASLLGVPTRLIPRHQRGMLLDFLQQTMLTGQLSCGEMCTDILTLMTRLGDLPKSSAQITSDWEEPWKLSDAISIRKEDSSSTLLPFQSFRQLHKAIIGRILVSSDVQRSLYFQKTFDKVCATIQKYDSSNFDTMRFFMLVLSLGTLHTHQQHFDCNLKTETLNALREKVLNILISDLRSIEREMEKKSEPPDVNTLNGILNALEYFEDMVRSCKDARKAIRKVEDLLDSMSYDPPTKRLVKRRLVSSYKPGKDFEKVLTKWLSLFPVDQLYDHDHQLFVRDIRHKLSTLSEKKLVRLVRQIRESGFAGQDAPHRLLLTGVAISCFEPIESPDTQASHELSSLFPSLSQCLIKTTAIESFSLATECLEMLLRNQSRSITQWNIDNILGTLSVVISAQGPKIAGGYAGVVYSRICHILNLVFGQYRKKLSGRFHLILPLMQRLLRLLFTPSPRLQKSSRSQFAPPPWVDNQTANSFLHKRSHATQYTRLLTALCDPTVSAVQRVQRSDSGLTDNTKKLKSIAGQHLQYLVMEYTGCQLRGQLAPELKAALMPGFYPVLDVMSKETMRGLNAAMDSSSRAVFKSLYDDYVRFGKWNNA